MNATRFPSLRREPSEVAKWLLGIFATGVLNFLAVTAFRQGEPDVLLSFALLLPWMVGPAASAALGVARARSSGEAWLFLGAELAVVTSTAWLWILVTFIKTGHANSEFAIGLILLPVVQFAALLIYAVGVIAIADMVIVKTRRQEKPRVVLLILLSIACAALLVVLAWLYGYIRA